MTGVPHEPRAAHAASTPPPGLGETEAEARAANNSLGELFGELTRDFSTLVRQEVALAKAELKESATSAGKGAGMLSGAAVAAYMVLLFLSLALWWALGHLMDLGWSALIVAALWAIIAAVLGEIVHLLEVTWPNPVSRVLLAPQVWLEKLLVREPHAQMVEVALCAYNAALENDR